MMIRAALQPIQHTDDALYQPFHALVALALGPVGTVLLAVALVKGASLAALVLAVPIVALGVRSLRVFKAYGWRGRPVVAVRGPDLLFSQPGSSSAALRLPLADLAGITVHGRKGQRSFRFLKKDGSFIESNPYFGRRLERVVEAFLARRLSPALKVTLQEPQTFFAAVRGEGP